jgi:uncharacterized membrane protein
MTHAWSTFTTWFGNLAIWQWWSPAGLFLGTPGETWKFQWSYVALVSACFIGGIILTFWKQGHPYLKSSLSRLLWSNFWLGLFLFFFRFQRIPILGMDIWRFIQEIAMIAWLVVMARTYSKQRPQEVLQEKVAAYKNRYLPKPKK